MESPDKKLPDTDSPTSTSKGSAPESLCLLRLSALGDVTHMLPVIHRLRHCWPDTRITWIIGKTEYQMVCDLPNIEFLIVDKKSGWGGIRSIIQTLKGRRFDVLLHMQVSFRANVISTFVRASRKIGFDRARSREMHGMFINERIQASPGRGEHVVDAFQRFLDAAGVPHSDMNWTIPVTPEDVTWAKHAIGEQRSLIISPCSSHRLRNWSASRYAKLADYAAKQHGLQIVLCGGISSIEREMGNEIVNLSTAPVIDLIGKDTIKRLLALIQQTTVIVSPDSGPAHMATCFGTPVLGLYAASNPERSGPYLSRESVVDRYNQAALQYLNKTPAQLRWGEKVEKPGAMDLITVEDVYEKLDYILSKVEN